MTTAIATPKIVFHRFAWKEYRMLRGFWLAVFGLAVLEQLVSSAMLNAGASTTGWLFFSAWGAAALYAVGAAVTLFGAENEERTREFLQILPTPWLPMFLAKVGLAVGSALLLAGVLCLTSWLISGQEWPTTSARQLALGVGSVMVLEATVWGLLFSLLWRQPLLAAIAAMAVASLGAQLAIGVTPYIRDYFSIRSYYQAIPARLLLCLGVFALDVAIARRWLQPRAGEKTKRQPSAIARAIPASSVTTSTVQGVVAPRRRMLARLLWQTWRESWKPLLAVIPLALFLMVTLLIPVGLMNSNWRVDSSIPGLVALFLPALLGALVFRADQRQDHRLFLTAHAARPRFVWLTRQLVWLGATLLLALGVQIVVAIAIGSEVSNGLMRFLLGSRGYGTLIGGERMYYSDWELAWDFQSTRLFFYRGATIGWCALFTAYALGQCCSMLLKREVLAGFLALLFSVVLAAWAMVVMFWGLSPVWFVLPLGVGAMLATWLRAPDWIVGRNRLRSWLLPSLVVAIPLLGMVLTLPAARLAQLDLPRPSYPFLEEPLETSLARIDESRAAGAETALEYERLAALLKPWPQRSELKVDGKTWEEWDLDILAKELDQKYGTRLEGGIEGAMVGYEGMRRYGEELLRPYQAIDKQKFMADPRTVILNEILPRFFKEQRRLYIEINQPVVERLLELSQRPHCRFPRGSDALWGYMQSLLNVLHSDGVQLASAGELEASLTRYCAWFRIQGHLYQSQPTSVRTKLHDHDRYIRRSDYYDVVVAWAQHEDQTSERLIKAIALLRESFKSLSSPREAILADWELVRDVLDEKEMPSFMRRDHQTAPLYLPFLANKLPWERQRAFMALEGLTENSLNYVDAVVRTSNGESFQMHSRGEHTSLRKLVRIAPEYATDAFNEFAYRGRWSDFKQASTLIAQCKTSRLVKQELDQTGRFSSLLYDWAEAETRGRALVVQLALLAYRLDHGEYPPTLDELTPDYLGEAVVDPFSGEEFRYRPQGFELPIAGSHSLHDKILPGTPLLWSVGIGNSKLQKRQVEWKTMLQFLTTEGYSWYPLVFSLPKKNTIPQ